MTDLQGFKVLAIGDVTADSFAQACMRQQALVIRAKEKDVGTVFSQYGKFDVVLISDQQGFTCLDQLATNTLLLLIDLPGIGDTGMWQVLCDTHPNTRITLVKPEMHRLDAVNFGYHAEKTNIISLVSRVNYPDLDPVLSFTGDLLSIFCCCELERYINCEPKNIIATDNMVSFDMIFPDKIYNFAITTNAETTQRTIVYGSEEINIQTRLDWPPAECYTNQISACFDHINNLEFWKDQYKFDYWIQRTLRHIHLIRQQ